MTVLPTSHLLLQASYSSLFPPQPDHCYTTEPLLTPAQIFSNPRFNVSLLTSLPWLPLKVCWPHAQTGFLSNFHPNISYLNSQISLQLHYFRIFTIMSVHCTSVSFSINFHNTHYCHSENNIFLLNLINNIYPSNRKLFWIKRENTVLQQNLVLVSGNDPRFTVNNRTVTSAILYRLFACLFETWFLETEYSYILCPYLLLKSEYRVCALPPSHARTYIEHNSCKEKGCLLQIPLFLSIYGNILLRYSTWERILQSGHKV